MKRLLLPLLAALALPTAVSAAEVYLLVTVIEKIHPSTFIVPMKTLKGCEEAGLKLISSERFKYVSNTGHRLKYRYECVESK